MTPSAGRSSPFGATWDRNGTNFSVFSANAKSVDLLLFDEPGAPPTERVPLTERTGYAWHAYVPDVGPGKPYAYSVDGPYDPGRGNRFNRNKVLLDPYARAVAGSLRWDDDLFGYKVGDPSGDLSFDDRDSSVHALKGVVIDPSFDWEVDTPPRTPWNKTVIYELHVKGYTKLRSDLDDRIRGTYAGLGSRPVISYLKDLGITAVELLPVHHHVQNRFLVGRGLTNYWGYNTISYFAPDSRYSSAGEMGGQVSEFKSMVKAMHAAGIEVILDVVYNHTAEGNHLGPTLSLRGIDNLAYYRLDRRDMRFYFDVSGTGNSMNMRNPFVLQLIMDSLRYWVMEMHVDGFRFDLAPALARERYDVDLRSTFFKVIHQDPVLSQVKLIAEPWDLGHGGYQVGNFMSPWAEWNDKYRNILRRFWKGEPVLPVLATRLAGSSDLYSRQNRGPMAGINFVTCHDGFTLNDLVSYNEKHNEANGEGNRDGSSNNHSWNCGKEGPSDDPTIRDLRRRQRKNFLASLLLSQGVPMMLGGDEMIRSQMGNNNAYCQDNEVSWLSWSMDEEKEELLTFVKSAIALRRKHPAFRGTKFLRGDGTGYDKDLAWLRRDGSEIKPDSWQTIGDGTLGMIIKGPGADEQDRDGDSPEVETFLLLMNGSTNDTEFTVPNHGSSWAVLLDTSGKLKVGETAVQAGKAVPLGAHTMCVLRKSS